MELLPTTQLYVEQLIIGLESSVWVTFVIANITGIDTVIKLLSKMGSLPGVLLCLGILYILGIVVDRLADVLVLKKQKRIEEAIDIKEPPLSKEIAELRLENYYKYTLSRLRVLRATIINAPAIGVSAIVFLLLNCINNRIAWICFASLFSAFLSVISYVAWKNMVISYRRLLVRYEQAIGQNPKQSVNINK